MFTDPLGFFFRSLLSVKIEICFVNKEFIFQLLVYTQAYEDYQNNFVFLCLHCFSRGFLLPFQPSLYINADYRLGKGGEKS